jgi:hypothetical protein
MDSIAQDTQTVHTFLPPLDIDGRRRAAFADLAENWLSSTPAGPMQDYFRTLFQADMLLTEADNLHFTQLVESVLDQRRQEEAPDAGLGLEATLDAERRTFETIRQRARQSEREAASVP